jgi:hypothetical protein
MRNEEPTRTDPPPGSTGDLAADVGASLGWLWAHPERRLEDRSHVSRHLSDAVSEGLEAGVVAAGYRATFRHSSSLRPLPGACQSQKTSRCQKHGTVSRPPGPGDTDRAKSSFPTARSRSSRFHVTRRLRFESPVGNLSLRNEPVQSPTLDMSTGDEGNTDATAS